MSAPSHSDRNLLFGILALQMDFITREVLITAMNSWVLKKAKPLGAILMARGDLSAQRHALLEALVNEHLKQHANDPQQSLAAVSSFQTICGALQQIDDAEVQASLALVSVARPVDIPDSSNPEQDDAQRREAIIDRFEDAWQQGSRPAIPDYLPPNEPHRSAVLFELVLIDLERSLRNGGVGRVEDYVREFPSLAPDSDRLTELLSTEIKFRRRRGEAIRFEELRQRFPNLEELRLRKLVAEEDARPVDPRPNRKHEASELETKAYVGAATSSGVRFHIVRPHARGGLGEVYVARDEELNREVALKEIQLQHADNPASRARFIMEAKITGGLEHPGIVPVYGLGQYGDGRPFYAMRFIRGDSLKEAVEKFHKAERSARDPGERSLKLRELLGRFVDVCNAVAYAHSRGVLHRDLKPGNIMLGQYGETLVVDWGLAKPGVRSRGLGVRSQGSATGEQEMDGNLAVGETTLRPEAGSGSTPTQMGSAIGTPQYMSPEQAAGRLDLLGPASDVYSLGATFYSLLTGQAPFKDEGTGEILRKVQRGDCPPPRQIRPSTPPALQAICLKAMALKPEDRYASPRLLADDVEKWLADEPVSAYRDRLPARVARWGRRHKAAVTSAAALLVTVAAALSIGIVLIGAKNQQIRQERDQTLAEKNRADENAERERVAKEAETARADETRAVVDFLEKQIFAAARPEGQAGGLGPDVTLRRAIESALPRVERSFSDRPLIEARLRMIIGTSFSYLGDAKKAEMQYLRVRELYTARLGPDHPDTLGSINNLAVSYAALGRHAEALKLREETLQLRKAKLGPDHPNTLISMLNLANSYYYVGRHKEALKLREETLQLMKAEFGSDHPDTLMTMNNIANSYYTLGRHAEALKLYEETLQLVKAKLGPDHPDALRSMNNLSLSYTSLGRHAEALKLCEETLQLRKAKLGRDHPSTLGSMWRLAASLEALNRGEEAVPLIDDCLKLAMGKVIDPGLVPGVMIIRGRVFQKKKDATGCLETADKWEALKRTDTDSLYSAACFRAVCAAVVKEAKTPGADAARLAKKQADLAMAWLSKAVAAGYKNAAHMKQDKDLNALRDRDDFKKLLAELEKAVPMEPKKEPAKP